MILSGPTIRQLNIITPHVSRSVVNGMSYGETYAGYDVRLAQDVTLWRGCTTLASTMERFAVPRGVKGRVDGKSTLARQGINSIATPLEPGWHGYLTLELQWRPLPQDAWRLWRTLPAGMPIAQVEFAFIAGECAAYEGKYQDQPSRPVAARWEVTDAG